MYMYYRGIYSTRKIKCVYLSNFYDVGLLCISTINNHKYIYIFYRYKFYQNIAFFMS